MIVADKHDVAFSPAENGSVSMICQYCFRWKQTKCIVLIARDAKRLAIERACYIVALTGALWPATA